MPRRVLGVDLPSERPPPTSLVPPGRGARRAKIAAAIVSGVVALGVAAVQVLPAFIRELRQPEQPEPRAPECATQSSVDDLSARVHRVEQRLLRQGEAICDANQGPPMVDFPCPDEHEYATPRDPPPLRRSPRVYPSD